MSEEEFAALAKQLENDFLTLYGSTMLTGSELQRALSYRTAGALRQAISRNTIPVKVFKIKNRRGYFALVKDIALWLATEAKEEE